jgi:hypothetical protein
MSIPSAASSSSAADSAVSAASTSSAASAASLVQDREELLYQAKKLLIEEEEVYLDSIKKWQRADRTRKCRFSAKLYYIMRHDESKAADQHVLNDYLWCRVRIIISFFSSIDVHSSSLSHSRRPIPILTVIMKPVGLRMVIRKKWCL